MSRAATAERPQRWELVVHGRRHRVEVVGSVSRTVTWTVDDGLVARARSSDDTIRLTPGDGLDAAADEIDEADGEVTEADAGAGAGDRGTDDPGAIAVRFTALGRTRRVTLYAAEGSMSAHARAVLGRGGIDLDPEPGSPAAQREERIRRHPRRHAAVAAAGGVAKVVLPLVLGLVAVRFVVALPWPDWDLPSIPWPDWDLPSIPWPDWDLPSIPWPDVDLPDWHAPDWLRWLAEHARYVWPVVLAWFLARAEIRRRRQQDELKARLADDAADPDADAR